MWIGRELLGTIFVRWRIRSGISIHFKFAVELVEEACCSKAIVGCCWPFLDLSGSCFTSQSMYLTDLFCVLGMLWLCSSTVVYFRWEASSRRIQSKLGIWNIAPTCLHSLLQVGQYHTCSCWSSLNMCVTGVVKTAP